MNALDVLVAPRALATSQGSEDAAAPGDVDATAGAFIALLNAMLGAKPLAETKPVALLATPVAEGEHLAEGATADGEVSSDNAVADGQPVVAVNGTALVSDGELVGIARAALETGKRVAASARPAAHSRVSRLLGAMPARVATTKTTPAAADATAPVDGSAVAPNGNAIAAAAAAAIVAQTPTADAVSVTEAPPAAASAPVPATLPLASSQSATPATTGGAGASALIEAVTQLLEGLTNVAPVPLTDAVAPELSSDPALAGVAAQPAADPSPTTMPGTTALPAGVIVEALAIGPEQGSLKVSARQGSSLREASAQADDAPVSDDGITAPARTPAVGTASMANTVDAASQRGVNTRETPLRSTLHDSAPAMPASARPRGELVAEAPAAEQLSGEHESSGSEHGNAQRERSERRAAVSDQSSSWSTNAGGSTTATRAESAATVVKDGVAARQPEEAPKLAQPTSHVTLQLDKDTLGASRIRVAVRGDTVRATILAEDGKVAALTAQLPELRRALEERGFTQARVTIQVEGHQEHQGNVIAGAMTDDLRAKPAASTRADQGRDEQQPRGGRRQDPDGDRPRDRRRQTPDEETE